jgi:hypothetical protein
MHDELFEDRSVPEPASDPSGEDLVYFVVGDSIHATSDSEVYSGLLNRVAEGAKAPFEEVKAEWDQMMGRIAKLLDSAQQSASPGPFELQEIQLQLAFNAKGRVAFIAEAGVDAGVTLTFRPRKKAE